MLAIIASIAIVTALAAAMSYYLIRLALVRRVRTVDIKPYYGLVDMGPAVLGDLRMHAEDFGFQTYNRGKGWEYELKCRGRKRLFFWLHTKHVLVDSALDRLRDYPLPFVWLHTACLAVLCAAAAVKILVWPHEKDVLALVGFDSITAEKLAGIKAAMERRDEAHD